MPNSHRPLAAAVFALGLCSAALPAFAVGAKCPPDTPVLRIESSYDNQTEILRCTAWAQAPTTCPSPTHPVYQQMPPPQGQPAIPNPPYGPNVDFCKPPNIVISAPSQVAPVVCPPGMSRVTDAGAGSRDLCRANSTSQVPPAIIPN